jgi:hypothetical protein
MRRRLGHAWDTLRNRYSRFLMQRLYRGRGRQDPPSRVLFWVPGGMSLMLDVEGALAGALHLRGADVSAVICDGAYRACVKRDVRKQVPIADWAKACAACTAGNAAALERLALPYSFIGDYVDRATRERLQALARTVTWESLEHFAYDGLPIGRNIRSAIIRYLQGHDFPDQPELVHEYAYSALVCAEAARVAYERQRPDRIFMSHGVYVDWGPALQEALRRGLPVFAWMASYLRGRFYFRRVEDAGRIDLHNMSARAWERWGARPLSEREERGLDEFLSGRYRAKNSFDMKALKDYTDDPARLRQRYRLPEGKPVWGVLAHINWDTVSDYSPMAYASFNEWIVDTVRQAAAVPDVTWIVKVHPAESWDNPESGVQRLLERSFERLPDNVRVMGAEEDISPLAFFELVDGGVTVYGTAGLELALLGKPVICAGEAHYGGKGFTHDGLTIESYRGLLARAPAIGPLAPAQRALARRYAHVYFLRRQIPLRVVDHPRSKWWRFRLDRRETLVPGRDPHVGFICERIADGGDFILDDPLA